MHELIIDNFAGGGGASLGIEFGTGRRVDIAINHDPEALAVHRANHPETIHYCEDVWTVDPVAACGGRPVGLAWFSPDCKHFSKAKGAKPVSKKIRGLAWVVIRWAKAVRPRVIMLENVEEFADWGPVLEDGRPCPLRKGFTFRRWLKQLQNLGYDVDMRELRACDYGAPTTRKRLFIIARCDGEPIRWPAPTHGPGLLPYRTAAECIDWTIPCPSIFDRNRPLAENTLRRIAAGIRRFVIENPRPFIVPLRGTSAGHTSTHDVEAPLSTVSAQGTHHALVTPFTVPLTHQGDARAHPMGEPFRTITGANRGEHALVAPLLVPRYGEREGQAPRALRADQPIPTIVPDSNQGTLIAAYLAKHNGVGGKMVVGQSLADPVHTITATDQKGPVVAQLGREPAGNAHKVYGFLMKFYSQGGQWASLDDPMHTIPTKDRMALVMVHGEPYYITDIGLRMLTPRELFKAQGFPESYQIDVLVGDRPLTKTAQVRMCGNSVSPPMAAALAAANYGRMAKEATA